MKNWNHALITGAGSGLGLGLAVRLLKRGSKVSVLDLSVNDENRAALDDAARLGNGRWQFIETNVTQEDQVHAAVEPASREGHARGTGLSKRERHRRPTRWRLA